MQTVFTLLEDIRQRPETFVGGDARDRIAQLRSLETLLYGYGLAIRAHGIEEPGDNFIELFGAYLNERFEWPTALGPVVAIVDGTPAGEDPWERFWRLVADFRQATTEGRRSRT